MDRREPQAPKNRFSRRAPWGVSIALFATVAACGGDGNRSGGGNDVCGTGGVCANGTPYQACASADGKSCSYQLGIQKFMCQSCGNCTAAVTALTQACVTTVMGPVLDFSTPDQPADMAMTHDLSGPPPFLPDMVVAAKTGCAGFTQCLNDCFASNPATATLSGCETTCAKTSKPTSTSEFQNALACGQSYCLGPIASGDMASPPYKCKLDSTGSSLINVDGTAIASTDPTTGTTGTKDCNACLSDALAKLFGDTCSSSAPADCSTAASGAVITACGAVTNTCVNDLP